MGNRLGNPCASRRRDSFPERQHPQDSSAHSLVEKPWVRNLLCIAALAAVLLILLHESLFRGKGLVPADGIFLFPPWNGVMDTAPSNYLLIDQYCASIPQHQFVQRRIMRGDFPFWNPHLSCGMPNLSINGALLFPIQLALSPIDPFYGSGPAAFLKLFLAGLFAMIYVRVLGVSHSAALLSGLVFSLCGFMIVWLGHPHVNCAMWLPLLLYFIEKQFGQGSCQAKSFLAAPNLRGWVGFAIAFGFMLLGGHPPTSVHVTIGIVIYFLFRLARHRKEALQRVVLLICSLGTGLLLAAPQLLPYIEYYRHSSSGLASAALERWASHLTPNTLIHFLLPYASGSPVMGFEDLPVSLGLGEIANFNERGGYVGIVPIFLALCAVIYRRCRFTFFYMGATVLSLLVIYGMPPLPAIMRALPVMNSINHTRMLLFTAFSVTVLAGLGLDTLTRLDRRRKVLLLTAGFWAASILSLLWFWNVVGPKFWALDQPHRTFLLCQLPVLAGGLIASGIATVRPARLSRWFVGLVCLGWTTFDLLWFGMGYNPAIPLGRYYPRTGMIEFLQKDPSVFRILGDDAVLIPNTAATYGLYDVRGYDFMTVRRYEEFITGRAGDFFFYSNARSFPAGFKLLNIKYVLVPKPMQLDPDQFELVYSGEVAVYRYKFFQERVVLLFDYQVNRNPAEVLAHVRSATFNPSQVLLLEEEPERENTEGTAAGLDAAVCIVTYEPDEVTIEASLPHPGFLLLLDTYFPGWSASVNGRPTRIYRADYNFRAVSLPSGKSIVHFSYHPRSLRIGITLLLGSFVLLCAVWFLPINRGVK